MHPNLHGTPGSSSSNREIRLLWSYFRLSGSLRVLVFLPCLHIIPEKTQSKNTENSNLGNEARLQQTLVDLFLISRYHVQYANEMKTVFLIHVPLTGGLSP